MAIYQTDCTVIGAGPGGYVAAIRLAQLGKKVVIVERDRLGGTCLNYGCIPSKALIHASSTVDRLREHGSEMGIKVSDPEIDMPQMMRWKDGVVNRLTGGVGQLLKANKVETVFGTASYKSARQIEVVGKDGTHLIETQESIIATGGRAFELPHIPFDGHDIISAREALDLQAVPKHLVIIGGGIIGVEIGTFMYKLGAKVSIVEMAKNLLPGVDPELSSVVARKLKKRGVKLYLEAKAQGVTRAADGTLHVAVETADGVQSLAADKVLVAVGWRPYTEGLGLDRVGLVTERGFLPTDEALRTRVAGIRAIGDVTGGQMLAHKASKEAIIAAESIAGMATVKDWRAMPAAVFCDPEIATVGLTVAQAKEAGYDVAVGKFPFTANGRALGSNDGEGFAQIVAEKGSGLLLGMHIVGPEASNLIAEGALGIEMGASAEDIALTIHTHPTLPEALMEAAEAVLGHAIHSVAK